MAQTHSTTPVNPSRHALPPQSIQAEESIISAILLDNETLFEVLDILKPEDFYRSAHQKIFAAISELFTKNEPCDLVTLTEILKNRGELEQIGGATYLPSIVDTAPLAVNAVHYARIIHNKASLRRLIEKANAIVKKCFEEQDDVDEVIDFAESSVFEISEHKINPAFFAINQLIDKNIETLEERQANKALVTGVSTGFSRLDTITSGFQPSDLIILAARPSMGKTSLALNIARNAAIDANTAVAIFSLEMSKEQLSMRMLCSEARIDSNRLRSGFFGRDDWDKLTDAGSILSDASIFIDDSASISAIEIRAKARRLKMDKNIGLILIDYLQLMKGRSSAERRDLEISEISRSLKGLAKELNIPIVALSQLNRKLEERGDKRPMLSDLRESGALEQDADVVAFIYRDEVYNKDSNNPNRGKAELILAKQRNGPVGTVHLAFLNTYTRFEALAPDDIA
ncbi:MAG: replicative DNA helicase [Deltaproteobacteria bacterium]|nr:replicative DNA helicase [Deltaproteobacteria bacterium]